MGEVTMMHHCPLFHLDYIVKKNGKKLCFNITSAFLRRWCCIGDQAKRMSGRLERLMVVHLNTPAANFWGTPDVYGLLGILQRVVDKEDLSLIQQGTCFLSKSAGQESDTC